MKQLRVSHAQIIYTVQQVKLGIPIKEVAGKHGVRESTTPEWRSKHDGLSPSELKRHKAWNGRTASQRS